MLVLLMMLQQQQTQEQLLCPMQRLCRCLLLYGP
jgi:hypothetical protein